MVSGMAMSLSSVSVVVSSMLLQFYRRPMVSKTNVDPEESTRLVEQYEEV
jgi:hypothetical protein